MWAILAAAVLTASSRTTLAQTSNGPQEGPVAREKPSVLVVPTRVLSSNAGERKTFDLLIATGLEELGFGAVDAKELVRDRAAADAGLAEARDLYLGLNLAAALATARKVREDRLARHGDILVDPVLTEAELVMIRILLDMGDRDEAARLADGVLAREPEKRLDPVEHSPAMQALWIEAIGRRAALSPEERSVDDLAAAARDAGALYAVAGVQKRAADSSEWLVVQIAPAAEGEEASRHPFRLGPRGSWAREVLGALEMRFGPAETEMATPLTPPVVPPVSSDGKEIWYKSWWFWTAVGIVVVGGIGIGVGAWASENSGNSIGTDDPIIPADGSGG